MHGIDSNSFCFRHVITRCSISTCTNPGRARILNRYSFPIWFNGRQCNTVDRYNTMQFALAFNAIFKLACDCANRINVNIYLLYSLANTGSVSPFPTCIRLMKNWSKANHFWGLLFQPYPIRLPISFAPFLTTLFI